MKSNIGTVTSSMQSLESNQELRNFRNININVDPWFETMALYSVLPDKQLALNGSVAKGEALAVREFLERNPTINLRHFANYGAGGIVYLVDTSY